MKGARIGKILRNLEYNNAKERSHFRDLQEDNIKMIPTEIRRENFGIYSVDSGYEPSFSIAPAILLNT
jgi:hypothetical protein